MDRQHDATTVEVVTTPPETYAYPTTDARHAEENRARQNDTPQILAELVIEEVSIDGMCGVY